MIASLSFFFLLFSYSSSAPVVTLEEYFLDGFAQDWSALSWGSYPVSTCQSHKEMRIHPKMRGEYSSSIYGIISRNGMPSRGQLTDCCIFKSCVYQTKCKRYDEGPFVINQLMPNEKLYYGFFGGSKFTPSSVLFNFRDTNNSLTPSYTSRSAGRAWMRTSGSTGGSNIFSLIQCIGYLSFSRIQIVIESTQKESLDVYASFGKIPTPTDYQWEGVNLMINGTFQNPGTYYVAVYGQGDIPFIISAYEA